MEHKTMAELMLIKEEEGIPRRIFQDRENPLDAMSDVRLVREYRPDVSSSNFVAN